MDLKSILLDVMSHTAGLGIENIKVTSDGKDTELNASLEKEMVVKGTLHKPVPEFKGEFGMGNLGLLQSLTKLSCYSGESGTVSIIRESRNDDDETPTTFVFEDSDGKDKYRLMSLAAIDQVLNVPKFKGAKWQVSFQPSESRVSQLNEIASIYLAADAPEVTARTEEGNLIFEVGGSANGIAGRRIFAKNIGDGLDSAWKYNLSTLLPILKLGLSGTCVMKFSNQGACQIDIDSGIADWTYTLAALK